ncbi:ABC transporter substrate-binding protein [Paenibacillus antarcticus]|uniref:Sugar ABC transporter substrate-binding protein n=1 Tax=Paenibacillus antarcticus TaxID=253703 RepID=A0A168PKS6_9BACL|nr:extracellular solute-binding protein [Paenibacillus antarcticus]OAB46860.1 hypothetical protein PBAT_09355 [Paenibacillus antarcticus]
MKMRVGTGSALIVILIVIGFLAVYIGYKRFEMINSVQMLQSKQVSNLNQPVKIKFGIWETKTDIEFWTKKVREYSDIKPNVTVQVEMIPDNSGQYLKVRLAVSDLPDVFYLKATHLPTYQSSLQPLDKLNATSRNRYPAELDGEILGLPLVSFTEYVYYHPSIFQEVGVEVPQTLSEFMSVLEKIKSHGKYIPIAIGGKDDWTFYPFMEFGPPMLKGDENYLSNISNMKEPFGEGSAFEEAANILKKIGDNQLAGSDALGIGFDQATQLFQYNQAAMIAIGQWYYSDHISKVGTDKDLDAFALPWRASREERLQAVTIPDQYMAINKNSQNTEEATAFLEWVFSPTVYQSYILNSQNSSTLTDVSSSPAFFNKVNNKHPFEPFMYDGISQKFAIIKKAAHYDEKKMAQEIFAGASVEDIQKRMNENWSKALQSIDIHIPTLFDK